MSNVITVENLGKKYTISHQQREEYSSLREVLTNSAVTFGKRLLHPFRRTLATYPLPHVSASASASEDFWALEDVSFNVKQGERIGIIGRNGAGKSTLLKILSRITEPTTGSIRIKGRVASLLEVGTGFHPELTGRENIFLNGAILGMHRAEIRRKFDDIVDFSEIEKFLDTPVKRYSSGMYVRLAFAVASYLEPDILIVDEVLAVGDAQFQKKCLGKMEDVGREGRTVLFVSHNMGAIKRLCSKCICLRSGKVTEYGEATSVIERYQLGEKSNISGTILFPKTENDLVFLSVEMFGKGSNPKGEFRSDEDICIKVKYAINKILRGVNVVVNISSLDNESIWGVGDWEIHPQLLELRDVGVWVGEWIFPANVLRPGMYCVNLGAGSQIKSYHVPDPFPFEITTEGAWRSAYHRFGISGGPVAHKVAIKIPLLCK